MCVLNVNVNIWCTLCVQSAEEQEDAGSAMAKNSLSKGYYIRKSRSDMMMTMVIKLMMMMAMLMMLMMMIKEDVQMEMERMSFGYPLFIRSCILPHQAIKSGGDGSAEQDGSG